MGGAVYKYGVSVVRPTMIDSPYGSEKIPDWSQPWLDPLDVRCSVQPETTREIREADQRVIVHAAWKLYTEPGSVIDLDPGDRLDVPGIPHQLQVVGVPSQWDQLDRAHTEITLEVYYG